MLCKAFDYISHISLLYKLKKLEIGSHVYALIKDMYVNVGSLLHVKVGSYLSNSFRSTIGVRQGDVLSPTLFNLYLNDIKDYLKSDVNTPCLDNKQINYLLYADDIVLLSCDEKSLQSSLNDLHDYCKKWKLEVNLNKTKIIVFSKSGKLVPTNIMLNGVKIEDVQSHKYLGLMFNTSGRFDVAKKDLLQRGLKAMYKVQSLFKYAKPNFVTSLHIFDHIVRPILLYGAEIWGDSSFCTKGSVYNKLVSDVIEECHLKFCKFTLGVNKRAAKNAVYGDTGRLPIGFNAASAFIKYWYRLARNEDSESLL